MHSHRSHCHITLVAASLLLMIAADLAFGDPPSLKVGYSGVVLPLISAITSQDNMGSSAQHPQWVLDAEKKMGPGFLTGLSGYEDFIMPVGMFVYFEDPFIRTDLRIAYVYHDIPDSSVLRGGQVHLIAAQIRVALSERWQFLATKDGYSWVDTHITSEGEGWNDIAIGLKYALHSDPANHYLVSAGLKWELNNGSTAALQGGESQELNPFVSFAKA